MTIAAWPASVSRQALEDDYGEQPQRNVASGPVEIGVPPERTRSLIDVQSLSWTTPLLTQEQVDALLAFYRDDLDSGVQTFGTNHPRTGRMSVLKFSDVPKIARTFGGIYQSISLKADVLSSVESETQAYLGAMTTQPDVDTAFVYDNFIAGMKRQGLWDKATDIRIFGAHHEQAARLSVLNPGIDTLSYAGGMSASDFTANQGFTGDGIGKHLISAQNYADITDQNSNAAFEWCLSNSQVVSGGGDIGLDTGNVFFLNPRDDSDQISVKAHSTTIGEVTGVTDSRGFFGFSRTGSGAYKIYQDVTGTARTDASSAFAVPSLITWFRNGSTYSDRQVFWTGLFSELNDTEVATLRRLVYILGRQLGALS